MSMAHHFYQDPSTLKSIQRVRMAFGVTHLSNVCSVDGTNLDKRFLQSQPNVIIKNNYDWPIKHHVSRYDMSKWRNLLRKIFCANALTLPHILGPWTPMSQSQWVETWDFFVTADKQFLFQNKFGLW